MLLAKQAYRGKVAEEEAIYEKKARVSKKGENYSKWEER